MTEQTRMFDLGDVLSISDGRLVSPRLMDGVYDICNFMTGDNLFTHQLPRAFRALQPEVLRQHPQLADVDTATKIGPDNVLDWLAEQKRLFGDSLPIAPLPRGVWVQINPVLEAQAVKGDHGVITLEI